MRWLLILLLLLPGAHAFGISQDYHVNNTLPVLQGASALQRVVIQNDLQEELDVRIVVNGDYVHIQGYPNDTQDINMTLPPSSYDNAFYINMSIPPSAEPGTVLPVSFTVQPLIKGEGMVAMGVRLGDNFNVRVDENPEYRKLPILLYLSYATAAIIIILAAYGAYRLLRKWSVARKARIPKGAFVTRHGHASSLPQLHALLQHSSEREIAAHQQEGDIALWVYEKTKDKKRYKELQMAKTKKEVLEALR